VLILSAIVQKYLLNAFAISWRSLIDCPYPEPARSSPYTEIPPLEDPSKYYSPISVWVSQVVSSPQVSSPNPLYVCPHPIHATCPHNSSFSIILPEQNWFSSTDHQTLIVQFSPIPCYLVPHKTKYSTHSETSITYYPVSRRHI